MKLWKTSPERSALIIIVIVFALLDGNPQPAANKCGDGRSEGNALVGSQSAFTSCEDSNLQGDFGHARASHPSGGAEAHFNPVKLETYESTNNQRIAQSVAARARGCVNVAGFRSGLCMERIPESVNQNIWLVHRRCNNHLFNRDPGSGICRLSRRPLDETGWSSGGRNNRGD